MAVLVDVGTSVDVGTARVLDVAVVPGQTPEGFRVVLNDDDMPELRLNRSYRALLKRAARLPVWADVSLRLSVAFFLIGLVILIHWLDICR